MKKVMSIVLAFLGMIVMIVGPAVASEYYRCPSCPCLEAPLEAQFKWSLDEEGKMILDASCSQGDIEKYQWEITDRDCNYLVERGYGCIFEPDIYQNSYGSGRYWVTLTVIDSQGKEDSICQEVTIPQQRSCRWEYREEFRLTKEERVFWGVILVVCIVRIIAPN